MSGTLWEGDGVNTLSTPPRPSSESTIEPAKSVQALMYSLIDYAGLFPPAKLAMLQTVENYARYMMGSDSWMLSRLIVPVDRLDEFEQSARDLLPRNEEDELWQISTLVADAGSEKLSADLKLIEKFNLRHSDVAHGLALIDVIELKAASSSAIDAALDMIPEDLFPYFEISSSNDPRGLIATLVGGDAGAKIRTGGVTADLFPSPANVARFLHSCANAGVAFKATAGMHRPLRHFSKPVQTKEFGFLTVFLAGALALHHQIDEATIVRVLEEESPGAFRFDDEGAAWRDLALATDQIEDARLGFAVSFGSCSFDEPREDLRALGLLPAE